MSAAINEVHHFDIADEALVGRVRAHQKHGDNSIEAIGAEDPRWLAILGEEIGEATDEVLALVLSAQLGRISHALTYDADPSKLRGELMDMLSVGFAWVSRIDENAQVPS